MARILMHYTFRADTAADWTSNDPTLLAGEIGYETDTGKFKIGDGSTAWTSHTYAALTEANIATISGDLSSEIDSDITTHAAGAGHDGRYYTETEIDNTITTVSGDLVAQLHTRSHAITSTADHTGGNWKVIYSDGSGEWQELAMGASGTVLTSQGASVAPIFV